jgi:peptidoglycan/LPS O-acetylase OafA/YrhL
MLLTAAAAAAAVAVAAPVDTAAAAGGDDRTYCRATAALAAAAAGSAAAAAEPRGGSAQALLAAAASAAALELALAAVSSLDCSVLQLHVLHLLGHCLLAALLQHSDCIERSTPPQRFAESELGFGSTCNDCSSTRSAHSAEGSQERISSVPDYMLLTTRDVCYTLSAIS